MHRKHFISLAIAGAALLSPTARAQVAADVAEVTHLSSDRGAAPAQELGSVTVHLKLPNQAAFDKAVEDLYTPGSPTYHRWMTQSDLQRYAPASSAVAAVTKELQSHGLTVLPAAGDGFSVRAQGPVSALENAFQTQIHTFERNGKTFHANITPARLTGNAAAYVDSVSGLTNFKMRSYLTQVKNPITGQARPFIPVSKAANSFSGVLTNQCFGAPLSLTLTTSGSSLPVGQYYGNAYTQGETVCGWTPSQIQNHYGLTAAYKAGLDGSGQSIVLMEGPTEATQMLQDYALFNKLAGLPAATPGTLEVRYPDGQPNPLTGYYWQDETDLDLQWAHAIAPKARIVVVIMPSQDWQEFEYGIQYSVANKLGNVISNSYGYPEGLSGPVTIRGFSQVIQKAAAQGVAVNFSTGDSGDEGTGSPDGGGASFPSDSPYATAVGGTSIGVPNSTGGVTEVGWGNNQALLSLGVGKMIASPKGVFVGGAGGGESTIFAKPSWQKSLQGSYRQEPDISAFADPYTGAAIVVGGQIGSIGGTSLSCPVFSAIWTLANEKAGSSLGQAAPLLATLSKNSAAILDVVPVSTPTNVAGIVFDESGSTYYSPAALLAPLYTTTTFTSAFWGVPTADGGGPGVYVDLSFGTDTSLQTAIGWDNVTGWGTPNGLTFINAAAKLK